MDAVAALGWGLLAGFAVAIPIGAVGVLLITEGVRFGFHRGWPAAAGVAAADAGYAIVVIAFGAAIAPLLRAAGAWPAAIGGTALVFIGLWALWQARTRSVVVVDDAVPSRGRRRFLTFFALTAVNPATALTFLAVTAGMSAGAPPPGSAITFVVGVAAASLVWQVGLVAAGAVLRRRSSQAAARVSSIVGAALVVLLGVAVLIGAVRG